MNSTRHFSLDAGFNCSVVESSDSIEHVHVHVVEDLREQEELGEHLEDDVDQVKWPEEPHVPLVPKSSIIGVDEDEDKSDDVSSEWSKD